MSLTSVAAPIWNEIAKTQKLKTEWARKTFALDAMAMAELENSEYQEAKKAADPWVAASFSDMKPLLLENRAISKFTQAQPQYRLALPEVVSVSEAVMLASMERPLSKMQQKQLSELLQSALN